MRKTTKQLSVTWILIITLLLAGAPITAQAFDLAGDELWTDGTISGDLETLDNNGTDPRIFWWSDENGDGGSGDAVSAGFDLCGYVLGAVPNVTSPGLTLNLDNGSGPGPITNSGTGGPTGDLSTSPSWYNKNSGKLIITNATHITVRNIDLRGEAGGGATIVHTGNMTLTGSLLDWHRGSGRTLLLDGQNAGALGVSNGIARVRSTAGGNYGVIIRNYTGVTVAGTASYDKPNVGNFGDYGINAALSAQSSSLGIVITNIGSGGINIPLGLSTWGKVPYNREIIIETQGDVTCGELNTHAVCWQTGKKAGDVTITAGGDVTLGNINTAVSPLDGYSAASCRGGNITVTTDGNIRLIGSIDAGNPDATDGWWGILSLNATNAITVGDLDCSKFRTIATSWTFDAGGSKSFITGVISNFDTGNSPSMDLRVPEGQIVYYDPSLPGNAYLNRARYSLDGGGSLRPPAAGTVIRIK